MRSFHFIVLSLLFFPALASAQQGDGQEGMPCMPGMSMPGCTESGGQQSAKQTQGGQMNMQPQNFIQEY